MAKCNDLELTCVTQECNAVLRFQQFDHQGLSGPAVVKVKLYLPYLVSTTCRIPVISYCQVSHWLRPRPIGIVLVPDRQMSTVYR